MSPRIADGTRRKRPDHAEDALSPPYAVWLTVDGCRARWWVCSILVRPRDHLPIRVGLTDEGVSIFFVGYRLGVQ